MTETTHIQDITAELLRMKKLLRVPLGGRSMYPFMRQGDIAIVIPFEAEKIKKGDVVVFQRNGKLLAHRMLGERDGYYRIKGDALWKADPPIPAQDVIGQIISFERNGKVRDFTTKCNSRKNHFRGIFASLLPFLRYF
ncbi:MAG: hypothetical protein KKA07_05780 [Bacteroidetes bacterium]|nr:hypothetical protein [Bacteroidota bacterium]MBU1718564.1 hypothetical protein [Bacteroidota bacterium]